MYTKHWGLNDPPFGLRTDLQYFHLSPTHDEALARLQFLVENGRRVGLLFGEHGAGKSLTMAYFAASLRRTGAAVARVNMVGIDGHELLWELAAQLGCNPSLDPPTIRLWQMLSDRFAACRWQNTPAVILLDDADQAPGATYEILARLAAMATGESPATLVLACRAENVGRLGRSVLELAELRIDLEPWSVADTEGFLSATLVKAGATRPLFSRDAIEQLQELSQGVPRRVSQLAELALLAGAGQERSEVDAATVAAACQELGMVAVAGV